MYNIMFMPYNTKYILFLTQTLLNWTLLNQTLVLSIVGLQIYNKNDNHPNALALEIFKSSRWHHNEDSRVQKKEQVDDTKFLLAKKKKIDNVMKSSRLVVTDQK